MWIRIGKILLVALAATYTSLVVLNNVTDYQPNFLFVQHVLTMDSTFPDNQLMWRAIESPVLHHAAYILIIAIEIAIAVLGWMGVAVLWRARNDAQVFSQSKDLAAISLLLGIVLWFGGFIMIAGEWFLMWQSKIWDAREASFRLTVIFALILMFLSTEEHE